MGLDYSINLYFPAHRVGAALCALARIAPSGPATVVRLPDGDASVPFSSCWKHDPVELLAPGSRVEFETSLLFPFDEVIRSGELSHGYEPYEGTDCAEIGYIYLRVHIGCLFAEFSFTAATSGMSRLFVASESIRGRFRELLAAADGVAGWLDQEDFEYHTLDDPTQTFVPEHVLSPSEHASSPPDEGVDWSSPDWLTAALCRGLRRPLPTVAAVLACRTSDTTTLARTMKDAASFDALPILADAMQAAGCDDEDVLAHCRKCGPHTRCCWVVDLLLCRG